MVDLTTQGFEEFVAVWNAKNGENLPTSVASQVVDEIALFMYSEVQKPYTIDVDSMVYDAASIAVRFVESMGYVTK